MQEKTVYKRCTICKEFKPISMFSPHGNQYLQSGCKPCAAARAKNKRTDPERNRLGQRKRSVAYATRQLAYFKEHPCVICGESDPLKLEFDHIAPICDKQVKRISQKWTRKFKLNDNNVQVLCASCHAAKTHKDFNTIRWQIVNEKYDEIEAFVNTGVAYSKLCLRQAPLGSS